MHTFEIQHCVKCQYDLRGSPGDICPECGTVQPPDGFDLPLIASTIDSDRTRGRKWIAFAICAAIIGGLLATGQIDAGGCCCLSMVGWAVASIFLASLAAHDRKRGTPAMRILFDHRGIHKLRAEQEPKILCDWHPPFRYRITCAGKDDAAYKWSLRVRVPFWSILTRSGVPDATFTFIGTHRDAARIRRFIKQAVGDATPGRIKRPGKA